LTRYGSFSFPDDFIYTWKKFISIAKREGKSASNVLRDFVHEYVDVHDPGNPQLRITSFSPEGARTIEQIIGRIRQQCLEYSNRNNGEIKIRIIEELLKDSKIRGKQFQPIRERLAKWLSDQGVKVWR